MTTPTPRHTPHPPHLGPSQGVTSAGNSSPDLRLFRIVVGGVVW